MSVLITRTHWDGVTLVVEEIDPSDFYLPSAIIDDPKGEPLEGREIRPGFYEVEPK